jgi:hypothetical protein
MILARGLLDLAAVSSRTRSTDLLVIRVEQLPIEPGGDTNEFATDRRGGAARLEANSSST